jgi:D-sedoheptulose 7-phosphate isomerase
MDYRQSIKDYIALEMETLQNLSVDAVDQALNLLEETRKKDGTIYIFGNGGSASTASHFQNDFNKGVSEYIEKKYRFCCLNDNIATVMAIANDIGYEEVFRFQLRNKLTENDIVMAISGSGNSKNVINAVAYAKENGCKVIGLSGFDGGKLAEMSDILLHVPANSMQITEDIHLLFDHLMMSVLYKELCGIDHMKK